MVFQVECSAIATSRPSSGANHRQTREEERAATPMPTPAAAVNSGWANPEMRMRTMKRPSRA